MGWIFVDKDSEENGGNMRSMMRMNMRTGYKRGGDDSEEYERGYKDGYKDGCEDAEGYSHGERRERDGRGRFM